MVERKRSPRHPSMGLAEALELLRRLYSERGKALMSSDDAARAWGYKGINGASARMVAALRQYALLEDVGNDVRVSQVGLTILLEDETHPEYVDAVKAAAEAPQVFQQIREEFADELPSDRSITAFLVRRMGFAEEPAQTVTAALRETLALVERVRSQQIGENAPAEDTRRPHPAVSIMQDMVTAYDQQQRQHESPPPPPPPPLRGPEVRTMRYEYSLSDGATATLTLAGDNLTTDDVEELFEWLGVVEKTLRRKVGTKPTVQPVRGGADGQTTAGDESRAEPETGGRA
jgi:hypothetical protein